MKQLRLLDSSYINQGVLILLRGIINVGLDVSHPLVEVLRGLGEETLLGSSLTVVTCRDHQGEVILNVPQGVVDLHERLVPLKLFNVLLGLRKTPLFVAHGRGAGPPREVNVDSDPVCLELVLDQF